MQILKTLCGSLLPALLIAAAQDQTPGKAPDQVAAFEERDWTLTELDGAKLPDGLRTIPRMRFSKGKVSGNGGCNHFFGSYTANGDALKIEKIGSTMMACAPPVIEQPTLKALSATVRYRVAKDRLELLGKDGKVVARLANKP
jgi:heat shock protein HslJ